MPTYESSNVNKSNKRTLKQTRAGRWNESRRRRMAYKKHPHIRYTVPLVYRSVRIALPSRCVRVFLLHVIVLMGACSSQHSLCLEYSTRSVYCQLPTPPNKSLPYGQLFMPRGRAGQVAVLSAHLFRERPMTHCSASHSVIPSLSFLSPGTVRLS